MVRDAHHHSHIHLPLISQLPKARPTRTKTSNKSITTFSGTQQEKKAPPTTSTKMHNLSMPSSASKSPTHLTTDSSDVKLAELWVWLMNQHNLDAMLAISDQNCNIHFEDSHMRQEDFFEEIRNLFTSFPDFGFAWNDVQQTGPGQVEIGFFQASGTHTGKPYGFGPYPPMEAKGIAVKNDPEKVIIEVAHDMIQKVTFIATGELTGPPGVYIQIGGFPM